MDNPGFQFRNPGLVHLLLSIDFLEGGGIFGDFKEKIPPLPPPPLPPYPSPYPSPPTHPHPPIPLPNPPSIFTYGQYLLRSRTVSRRWGADPPIGLSNEVPAVGGRTPRGTPRGTPSFTAATPSYPSTISPSLATISYHPTRRRPSFYPRIYCKA